MNIKLIGLDIAKSVFHLIAVNQSGNQVLKKVIRRQQLSNYMAKLPSCLIVMEACGSASYWARIFKSHGHEVKLIAPQHVKPFVRGNKNDFNDALAITVAAQVDRMSFVPIKTTDQQDMQMLHRMRSRSMKNRTALCNQVRGLLAEYGITINLGVHSVRKQLPLILEDDKNELSMVSREYFARLYDELIQINETLGYYDTKIVMVNKQHDECHRLMEISGIGPITASALYAAVGQAKEFKNGRHLSAWLGLVPGQHSTGGKSNLLSISKRGNSYLRTLLVHGGRAVLKNAPNKEDKFSCWATALKERRGFNKACVAIANKLARMAWVVLHRGEHYKVRAPTNSTQAALY